MPRVLPHSPPLAPELPRGCQLEVELELDPEEGGGVAEEPEEVFVAAPSGVLDFPSDFASEDVDDDGFSASIAFFRDSEG